MPSVNKHPDFFLPPLKRVYRDPSSSWENTMSTKEIVENYYGRVQRNDGWQALISDDIKFVSPGTNTSGKAPYIEATSRFLGIVKDVKVKDLIIEGDKACALVDNAIVSPNGDRGSCFVAEFLSMKEGK